MMKDNDIVDENIWVISDTHFHHERIWKGRGFSSLAEHDETLINNWNSVIRDTDIVYHLGDFALGNVNQIESTLSKLKGDKILIKGNHDKCRTSASWKRLGFSSVKNVEVLKNFLYLMHEPVISSKIRSGSFILHGHTHSRKVEKDKYVLINTSVELIGYTPIQLNRLIEEYFKFIR